MRINTHKNQLKYAKNDLKYALNTYAKKLFSIKGRHFIQNNFFC